MPGDNFKVEVRSEGKAHFESAIRLAWANVPGGRATHYVTPLPIAPCPGCFDGQRSVWKDKEHHYYPCPDCKGMGKTPARDAMVLLWHEGSVRGAEARILPYSMDCEAAITFLWNWLTSSALYQQQPDHNGSNGKGFLVSTGDPWGRVEGSHYAFVGVYPEWQMYGK